MSLAEDARRAVQELTEEPYVRVLAGLTPDASAGAAILTHALHREGVDFHLSFLPEIHAEAGVRLAAEKNPLTVLLDCPVTAPECIPGLGSTLHRFDRHRGLPPVASGVDFTPERAGADGVTECVTATLAYAVARAMNHHNATLLPLALAAARLEGQHLGGWHGLNAEFLAQALEEGAIEGEGPRLALDGVNLIEALSQGVDPYFPGFAGRARVAMAWLTDLDLPAEEPIQAFDAETTRRTASALALRLLEAGAPETLAQAVSLPIHAATGGPVEGRSVPDLARLLSASLASGAPEAPAMGLARPPDAKDAEKRARAFRERVLQVLLKAEREETPGRVRVLEVPDRALLEPVAQAASRALSTRARPSVAVVHRGDARDVVAVRFGPAPTPPSEDAFHALERAANAAGGLARAHRAGGTLLLPDAAAGKALVSLGAKERDA